MQANFYDFSQTRTVNGVEQVLEVCGRCGGKGHLPGYEYIEGGVCFQCRGSHSSRWVDYANARKVQDKREKAREYRARAAARKAEREAAAQAEEFAAWSEKNSDLLKALLAYDGRNEFLFDMASRVEAGTALTERQTEAAAKAIAALAEREANVTDVPVGRQSLEGVVLSTKREEDRYSYSGGTILKMLVDCGGFRVYGTVPADLCWHEYRDDAGEWHTVEAVKKGDKVSFTATLKEGREKGFGIFQRPTKARITETAAPVVEEAVKTTEEPPEVDLLAGR